MAWLGLDPDTADVDGLLHRLYLIRTHTPQTSPQTSAPTNDDNPEH